MQRDLFLLADWTVLPPVGGITIYEAFEVTLHPIRLQIDTRVGRRIMEYVWPARRDRNQAKAIGNANGEPKEKEKDDEGKERKEKREKAFGNLLAGLKGLE